MPSRQRSMPQVSAAPREHIFTMGHPSIHPQKCLVWRHPLKIILVPLPTVRLDNVPLLQLACCLYGGSGSLPRPWLNARDVADEALPDWTVGAVLVAGFLGMLLLDQVQHRVGGPHAHGHAHAHGRGTLHLRNSDDDLEQAAATLPPRTAGKVCVCCACRLCCACPQIPFLCTHLHEKQSKAHNPAEDDARWTQSLWRQRA